MFTGIVQAIGRIERVEAREGDCRITIDIGALPIKEVALGDSIAVNGVCLTAVALGASEFCADVSRETLSRTTLSAARSGERVNLELALLPTSRLGGHLVSGHVDGIGTIVGRRDDARSTRFTIEAPRELTRYIAAKGSICLDGISLTVNEVEGPRFGVNIVPHTLRATTLGEARIGRRVNLEVDVIARYLERLLLGHEEASQNPGVGLRLLEDSGFLD